MCDVERENFLHELMPINKLITTYWFLHTQQIVIFFSAFCQSSDFFLLRRLKTTFPKKLNADNENVSCITVNVESAPD
jgi:hypothetical protein